MNDDWKYYINIGKDGKALSYQGKGSIKIDSFNIFISNRGEYSKQLIIKTKDR